MVKEMHEGPGESSTAPASASSPPPGYEVVCDGDVCEMKPVGNSDARPTSGPVSPGEALRVGETTSLPAEGGGEDQDAVASPEQAGASAGGEAEDALLTEDPGVAQLVSRLEHRERFLPSVLETRHVHSV